eukprot:1157812-Pelagomonas_calceolata.AAC.12
MSVEGSACKFTRLWFCQCLFFHAAAGDTNKDASNYVGLAKYWAKGLTGAGQVSIKRAPCLLTAPHAPRSCQNEKP